MPTCICISRSGLLAPDRKAAVAAAVTRTHAEVTGAPTFFAQVVFQDVQPADHFIGGVPLAHDHLFVYGRIRAGRSARDRHILIEGLVHSLAAAAGLPPFAVWVYVLELPARAMAEFGHILPEPGDEADWTRMLPEADRARMQAIGARA